jgi:hypothetical protein
VGKSETLNSVIRKHMKLNYITKINHMKQNREEQKINHFSFIARACIHILSELRIVPYGSSSSPTVRQRESGCTAFNLEGVPQARLPCLQLFSCLYIIYSIYIPIFDIGYIIEHINLHIKL